MNLVTLPKGVKVYAGGKCFTGKIPSDLCPEKYATKTAPKKAK